MIKQIPCAAPDLFESLVGTGILISICNYILSSFSPMVYIIIKYHHPCGNSVKTLYCKILSLEDMGRPHGTESKYIKFYCFFCYGDVKFI